MRLKQSRTLSQNPLGRERLVYSEVIANFLKGPDLKVHNILKEVRMVSKNEYDRIVDKEGDFVITQDGRNIRKDFDAITQINAEKYIFAITKLDINKVDWMIFNQVQLIDNRFEIICEGCFVDINAFELIDNLLKQRYHITWHDQGYQEMLKDTNSRKSHYNLDYTTGKIGSRKTINQHINYK